MLQKTKGFFMFTIKEAERKNLCINNRNDIGMFKPPPKDDR